jgi:addiction module HigA family antidote
MHPGEVLSEEFLKPYGLSAYRVAKQCGIPRTRIERIVREEVGITADTALRLAKFFNTTPQFWLNLQNMYDVEAKSAEIGRELEQIHEIEHAA